MDRIRLLQSRKKQILDAGKDIRKDINSLVDDKSFVELSVFSFILLRRILPFYPAE